VRALGIAPDHKLQVLGSGSSKGVDVRHFHPGRSDVRQQFGVPSDAKVIGFVGRLTHDKGIPALIDAFDRILQVVPHSHLLLVGWFDLSDDKLDSKVRDRITRHPRIVCTGFVDDVAPYYRAMDLLILPTQREGFPNVVLEASATGIPVITTLSTGASDSVVNNETGLLVPGDPRSISAATLGLLLDPAQRRRMGEAGRARAREQFLDQHIYSLTTAFYKDMIRTSVNQTPGAEIPMDLAASSRSPAA
jgi:glycosyltransferase involved in cell wall biosynthesis